jgi:predicted branched-subunit amino acid permease
MSLFHPAHALRAGARDAVGAPALIIAASFLGFGSLCRESGFSIWLGLASTATSWALPGQIVLVEFYAIGASLAATLLAVGLTNARLLPMTVVLTPMLRAPGTPRWQYFLISHLIAVTGWTRAMQHFPSLPPGERLPYYTGFSLVLWSSTLVATAAGYVLATHVPAYVTLGLVFLNPIYFMLVFIADLRQRERAFALGLGAVAGPLLHLVDPDWGLLATGLVAGTAAFLIAEGLARAAGRGRGASERRE